MEDLLVGFLISLVCALIGGYIVNDKLHMPAGGMVGGMVFVGALNIFTGIAYYPPLLKVLVQSAAGGFIGIRIKKEDLKCLKELIKPMLIMVIGLMIFNISAGIGISKLTSMDLPTALLSTTPGGLTETAMMSADLGANQSAVTIMHLMRIIFVIGTFPTILRYVSMKYDPHTIEEDTACSACSGAGAVALIASKKDTMITAGIAIVGGFIGYLTKLPAGTMSFAMISVATYNILTSKATLPLKKRKYVQMCAGLTIGATITMADVLNLKNVIIPALMMLGGYAAVNILLSVIISRYTKVDLTTALFATSPGGVSDMALIAMEVGGDAPKIATMQLVRLLTAVTIFPLMIKWICSMIL